MAVNEDDFDAGYLYKVVVSFMVRSVLRDPGFFCVTKCTKRYTKNTKVKKLKAECSLNFI